MSTKFLDKTGLSYFFSKLKTLINSKFPLDVTYVNSGSYDLNDYTNSGSWVFSTGTTLSNVPNGSNGFLIVLHCTNGMVRQFWLRTGTIDSNEHNFFFRLYNGTGSWSTWKKIYTSADILPIANGGTGSSTKNFVDLSSSQTISAEKIFPDGNVGTKIGGSNGASLKFYRNTHTLGQEVSSNQYTTLISVDSADQPVGQINLVRFSTRTAIRLRASNLIPGETEETTQQIESEFQIVAWDDGRVTSQVSADFYPATNNVFSLGVASKKWTEVFATTGTINTSDERLKTSIESIPDEVLDAWGDVGWVQYKLRDSVEKKGPDARLHNGLIAQRIDAIFRSHGLNAADYGLFCYDKWDERYDDVSEVIKEAVLDENGNEIEPAVIKKVIEHTEAGDAYSLRYEEALSMEAAYLRRENARLKERVSDLEDRLAALELRLGSA